MARTWKSPSLGNPTASAGAVTGIAVAADENSGSHKKAVQHAADYLAAENYDSYRKASHHSAAAAHSKVATEQHYTPVHEAAEAD